MSQLHTIANPFSYDHIRLGNLLQNLLEAHLASDAMQWLLDKAASLNEAKSNALAIAFSAMPRKTGKAMIVVPAEISALLQQLRSHFTMRNWTADRLGRVWLLLQVDAADQTQYVRRIEQLFPAAEMNELVALYSALPLLAFPEAWRSRCAEGIRSNIGPVLEAVICNNPYPSEQLPEGAWNQLVLKGFFTEKPIDQIIGLDQRANAELAKTLVDFARERRAAGRAVPPMLWRLVAPFVDETNFADLKMAFVSTETFERDAAALACAQTAYAPAKDLLASRADALHAIDSGALTWGSLAAQMANS